MAYTATRKKVMMDCTDGNIVRSNGEIGPRWIAIKKRATMVRITQK